MNLTGKKKNLMNWTSSKLKTAALLKDLVKKIQRQSHRLGENIHKIQI
jgi:hypothetical protein